MGRVVTVAERRDRLAHRHLLTPSTRTDDVAAIADALVALHSSDPVSVYLSALARMATPSIVAIERALYDERSVIRHHAMRRTLWVATRETTRRTHVAATRKIAAAEHRRTIKLLGNNGIDDPEAWLRAAKRDVLAALRADGPMTARELGRRVPALAHPLALAPGKAYASSAAAHTRVLLLLGFEGALVRTRPTGSWINGQYTWSAMQRWVPDGVDPDGDSDERGACRDLAAHWLSRFGPATMADLQWWSGWTAAATRQALADAEAREVELDGATGFLAAGDEDPVTPARPWVALLPGLDPTTMGWKRRDWYLPQAAGQVFDRNGNAGPTVWVDGQVVGAWAQPADGVIRLHWFLDVPASRRAQVRARADELADLLGPTRHTVRFPSPIHASLLATPASTR